MRSTFFITSGSFGVFLLCGAVSSAAADDSETSIKQQIQEARIAYRDTLKNIANIDLMLMRMGESRGGGSRGGGSLDRLIKAETALRDAELAVTLTSDERNQVVHQSLERFRKIEAMLKAMSRIGFSNADELLQAQIARGHAELALASTPAERARILKTQLNYLRKHEAYLEQREQLANRSSPKELTRAQIARAKAELALTLPPDERIRILNASRERARQLYAMTKQTIANDASLSDELIVAMIAVRDAELAVASTSDERIEVLEANLERTRKFEGMLKSRTDRTG
jgi:hypothetical protein